MAYSIEEEDKMMALIESIANQPIEAQRPYNEVRNPKPMMESACFEGTKVDFSSWTEDKEKVGKAKTATDPDLTKGNKTVKNVPEEAKVTLTETKGTDKPVTENDVVNEKKEDKQVTELVTDDASHEAKDEPKPKAGKFDTAAKSAASAQRSKADSNKKFSEESKKQRKIQMFKDFVKSLGVDEESKAAAEKVLKKFDEISKHIGEPGDSKTKPKLESADSLMEGFNSKTGELKRYNGSVLYLDQKNFTTTKPLDELSAADVEEQLNDWQPVKSSDGSAIDTLKDFQSRRHNDRAIKVVVATPAKNIVIDSFSPNGDGTYHVHAYGMKIENAAGGSTDDDYMWNMKPSDRSLIRKDRRDMQKKIDHESRWGDKQFERARKKARENEALKQFLKEKGLLDEYRSLQRA